MDLLNPEKLFQEGNNSNSNSNKKIRLFKHSLNEEVENFFNEWKMKKENEIRKFKAKIKSLIDDVERDKVLKIAKIEADSQKIINRLNLVETIFKRDSEEEIEKYFLSVKKSQESIKNSNESKLVLQHAEILKEEIKAKSNEIQNLEEFYRLFIYSSNFNGEHVIGRLVKHQSDGFYTLIK